MIGRTHGSSRAQGTFVLVSNAVKWFKETIAFHVGSICCRRTRTTWITEEYHLYHLIIHFKLGAITWVAKGNAPSPSRSDLPAIWGELGYMCHTFAKVWVSIGILLIGNALNGDVCVMEPYRAIYCGSAWIINFCNGGLYCKTVVPLH